MEVGLKNWKGISKLDMTVGLTSNHQVSMNKNQKHKDVNTS